MTMKSKKKNAQRQNNDTHDDDDDDSVDYAAAADHHANTDSSEEDENVADDDDSSDEDDQEEAVNDNEELEEESSEDEIEEPKDDDNDDSDEEENDQVIIHPPKLIEDADGHKTPCNLDLRNLLATSTHPIDSTELYNTKKNRTKATSSNISFINPEFAPADEDMLQRDAEQSCQQLIAALWQLPRIRSSSNSAAGPPMVMLPSFDNSKIPRALVSCDGYS